MNVVFIAARSWPAVGGIESYLRDLTRALARRHTVKVLAHGIDDATRGRLDESLRPPSPFSPFVDGDVAIEQLRLPISRRSLLAPLATQVVPGLRRYAYGRSRVAMTHLYARVAGPLIAERARGADLVHMWGGGMSAAAALHAARVLGVPFAITPFAHEGRWGDDGAVARTYREADAVIALLQDEAALYRRLGVAPERLAVAGVLSPGAADGGGAALRRRHGIDGPLVLFLGARRPYKGLDLLLDAAGRAAAELPGLTLAVVGPGDAVDPRDRPLRVVDAGHVDEAERAAWLDAADLLCLPSASEIFPTSFLEAWSVGTPVLTSDIPPLAELIALSGGGWTAPREVNALAEALVTALSRPMELRRRGAAGRAFWSQRCTVHAVSTWFARLYSSLVQREREREVA